jgi:nucleoside-diphosphate-sugar epimerase
MHVVASPGRATEELGFEATVPFREGLLELAREFAGTRS